MLQVWESILRHQVQTFLSSLTGDTDIQISFDSLIDEILSNLDLEPTEEEICQEDVWSAICLKREEVFSIFSEDMIHQFDQWRILECSKSNTFSFWDTFVHVDILHYLGFYYAIRTRNWNLRNACLKKLSVLFHAFDKHNYLRMIPYHLADLQTFPQEVLDFFFQRLFCCFHFRRGPSLCGS